jgi:hypothetical protein
MDVMQAKGGLKKVLPNKLFRQQACVHTSLIFKKEHGSLFERNVEAFAAWFSPPR